MAKYNMTFEEDQEYISKRGFDIAWNDCDVFIDVRHITQAVGNVLKWADNNPKWKPSDEQMKAFENVYDWYRDNSNFVPSIPLHELYKDLKKLKG